VTGTTPTPTPSNEPRDLAELQRWLRWIFTDPRGVKKVLKGFQSGPVPEPLPRRLDSIESQGSMSRERRLQVYADGYFGRLHDNLAEDFDTVFRTLGAERFQPMISAFLQECPSRTHTVSDVGRGLPDFLRHRYRGAQIPYLADMAALDWAVNASFFADDLPALDVSRLPQVAPESWSEARFGLDASVHLLRSRWSIDDAWEHKDWDPRVIARKVVENSRYILVYRKDEEVWVEEVGEIACLMLESMRAGRSLAELSSEIPATVQASAEQVQEAFGQNFGHWVAEGVLRRIDFPQ
jgi:hypothetical protein